MLILTVLISSLFVLLPGELSLLFLHLPFSSLTKKTGCLVFLITIFPGL